jgi:hypothetical protein
VPVCLDDQQVGAHGGRAAGLHRRLAVHLAADDQLRGRLRQPLPRRLRGGAHFGAAAAAGRCAGAGRARAAVVGPLYEAVSGEIFDSPGAAGLTAAVRGSRAFVEPLLARAGLPAGLADALDDTRWDEQIRAEGDEALTLTGKDVGTPIIQFGPPDGTAFFGPVISRLPSPEDAVRLWDYVTGLAAFPGFAELKRSLRERPQLPSFGVRPGERGVEEDWHGGSRRQKR